MQGTELDFCGPLQLKSKLPSRDTKTHKRGYDDRFMTTKFFIN